MPLSFHYAAEKNPFRQIKQPTYEILKKLGDICLENQPKLESCQIEMDDENLLRKKYFDIGETYIDKYVMTFKLTGFKDKYIIYKIHFPKIFNGQFTIINGVPRINLIQSIDNEIIKFSDKIKFWNNILSLSVKIHNIKGKTFIGVYHSRKYKYDLLSLLFEKYNGVHNFLKVYFPECSIQKKSLNKGESLGSILKFDPSYLTDPKFKGIYDFFPKENIDNINKKESWMPFNKYLHHIQFIDYVKFTNKLDIFSPVSKMDDYLDKIFINLFIDNSKLKNDLSQRRLRCLEIFYKPIIKNLSELLFVNYKMVKRDKLEKIIDIPSELVTTYKSSQQILSEQYTPIHRLGELDKVTYSGSDSFEGSNCNNDVRNIHESYRFNLCPVATPDSEKVGIVNYFSYNSELLK